MKVKVKVFDEDAMQKFGGKGSGNIGHKGLKDVHGGSLPKDSKKEDAPVTIKSLIKRMPEKETGYDRKNEKEYWKFKWSDGTIGEGSLFKSQRKKAKLSYKDILKKYPGAYKDR